VRILTTAYDYRPRLGGVATCAYELGVAISRIPGIELRMLARSCEGGGAEQVDRESGIPTRRIELPDSSPLAALAMARALRQERRDWAPDAILNTLWLPGGVASRASGIPYYLIAHGVEVIESSATLRKQARQSMLPLKRLVFSDAEHVFAVSRFTASKVVSECGADPARVSVCNNGVNPSLYFAKPAGSPEVAAIRRRHGAEGRVLFLTVTRLLDFKGVDYAIRAMKSVVAEEPRALYLVCGEGRDLPRLREKVSRLGLERHVAFAGPVPGAELNDYYNACDAHVLLSREDWDTPNFEGFGLVFLEAAACGKPSIAGHSGGIQDAVADGRTGWLVPPTDPVAIGRAMLECARDEAKRRELGAAAMARALGELTWDRMARQIVDCMRQKAVRDVRD
jgi:phosphatidylinositol alpha-1,6-mannosyltransferase